MTSRRRRSRGLEFARRHPVLSLTSVTSVGTGVAVDRWLTLSGSLHTAVTLTVFALLILAYWLYNRGYGAVYVVMGRHPVTGARVCLYVGMTTQRPWTDRDGTVRYPRVEQHILGSDLYGVPPKPWSDTVTDWCFAYESRHTVAPLVLMVETVNIRLRRPLYNDKKNRGNSRRIDKRTAIRQRAERDRQRAVVA